MANAKKTKETKTIDPNNLVMGWKIIAKENGTGYGRVPMLIDKTTGREVTIEDLEKLG